METIFDDKQRGAAFPKVPSRVRYGRVINRKDLRDDRNVYFFHYHHAPKLTSFPLAFPTSSCVIHVCGLWVMGVGWRLIIGREG